jgi:AraC-like DNA-binding protein
MDLLSRMLAETHLESSLLASLPIAQNGGVDFGQGSGSPTHYVQSGEAWVHFGQQEPILVRPGDLVMVPRWEWHAMAASPGAPTSGIMSIVERSGEPRWNPGDLLDRPLRLSINEGAECCHLLSMIFRLNRPESSPLLMSLPSIVLVRRADQQLGPIMEATARFVAEEASAPAPGYSIASNRLAGLLFIQIIRHQMNHQSGDVRGFLRALSDKAIGHALTLMHGDLAKPWTLAMLAREIGLSRSALAERFARLMGVPFATYLAGLRMEKAAAWLERGESVKSVAALCGYANGHSFARAEDQRAIGTPFVG